MRVLIQRVKSASVSCEEKIVGQIGIGLLLYIGVAAGDTAEDMEYIVDKIPKLRIFSDENDKMNLALNEVNGSLLAVSQFTLMGDCSHGRRPGFSAAMAPAEANAMYEKMVALWREAGIRTETGIFQGDMLVTSVNWGPVTFILDSKSRRKHGDYQS